MYGSMKCYKNRDNLFSFCISRSCLLAAISKILYIYKRVKNLINNKNPLEFLNYNYYIGKKFVLKRQNLNLLTLMALDISEKLTHYKVLSLSFFHSCCHRKIVLTQVHNIRLVCKKWGRSHIVDMNKKAGKPVATVPVRKR